MPCDQSSTHLGLGPARGAQAPAQIVERVVADVDSKVNGRVGHLKPPGCGEEDCGGCAGRAQCAEQSYRPPVTPPLLTSKSSSSICHSRAARRFSGGVGELFVDRLAPAHVLFLFEEDVVQDADGRRVADLVGDLAVVAVVDGEVRLHHAVEPDDAQQLVLLELHRLAELQERSFGGSAM